MKADQETTDAQVKHQLPSGTGLLVDSDHGIAEPLIWQLASRISQLDHNQFHECIQPHSRSTKVQRPVTKASGHKLLKLLSELDSRKIAKRRDARPPEDAQKKKIGIFVLKILELHIVRHPNESPPPILPSREKQADAMTLILPIQKTFTRGA
jgi:hypothetical protein